MSAILELQVYTMQRQVLETITDPTTKIAVEHFFECTRKFKTNEEEILGEATKLVKHASNLMVQIEQGLHAHDWTSSTARDLGQALAKREMLIDAVGSAAYLVETAADIELANSLRTAVFG